MKFSKNWLHEYINLTNIETKEILDKLCDRGIEIDRSYTFQFDFQGIIAARVLEIENIPNYKIRLCKVFDGKNELSVFCGAPMIKKGSLYAFAPINSVVGEQTILKRKIAGAFSEGMLCSGSELGFQDSRLLELSEKEFKEGDFLSSKMFPLTDTVFEVADGFTYHNMFYMEGMAREIASILGIEMKIPQIQVEASFSSDIIIENKCIPSLVCREIRNLSTITPIKIKQLLSVLGVNNINKPVDICNFVCLKTGQPLHAYDRKKIKNKIIVTHNQTGKIIALNNQQYEIKPEDIVVTDGSFLSIMGIIGGLDSSCDENTDSILLEAPILDEEQILVTSQRLNIVSDSSYRFSRGVEDYNQLNAIEYASFLMDAHYSEIIGCQKKHQTESIFLSWQNWFEYTGISLDLKTIHDILVGQGYLSIIKLENRHGEINQEAGVLVQPPVWKTNKIKNYWQIIEEVLRVYSLSKIVEEPILMKKKHCQYKKKEQQIRSLVALTGYTECLTSAFYSTETAQIIAKPHIEIKNPASRNLACLRVSLAIQLEDSIKNSIMKNKNLSIKLFQIGKVYNEEEEKNVISGGLYGIKERNKYGLNKSMYTINDAAGDLKSILLNIGYNNVQFGETKNDNWLDYYSVVSCDGHNLGWVGVKGDIYLWELDLLNKIDQKSIEKKSIHVREISFDISFQVKKEVSLFELLTASTVDYIDEFYVLDVFEINDKKSVTIRYHKNIDNENTQEEINHYMNKITQLVCSKLECGVRD